MHHGLGTRPNALRRKRSGLLQADDLPRARRYPNAGPSEAGTDPRGTLPQRGIGNTNLPAPNTCTARPLHRATSLPTTATHAVHSRNSDQARRWRWIREHAAPQHPWAATCVPWPPRPALKALQDCRPGLCSVTTPLVPKEPLVTASRTHWLCWASAPQLAHPSQSGRRGHSNRGPSGRTIATYPICRLAPEITGQAELLVLRSSAPHGL
mmetsp:Transcript_21288/g.51516  ORF Transcript_21288/g.51516 Transcript_21288/m.51516 type:complete len:210 (+) Transcript_21288:91-720(+)